MSGKGQALRAGLERLGKLLVKVEPRADDRKLLHERNAEAAVKLLGPNGQRVQDTLRRLKNLGSDDTDLLDAVNSAADERTLVRPPSGWGHTTFGRFGGGLAYRRGSTTRAQLERAQQQAEWRAPDKEARAIHVAGENLKRAVRDENIPYAGLSVAETELLAPYLSSSLYRRGSHPLRVLLAAQRIESPARRIVAPAIRAGLRPNQAVRLGRQLDAEPADVQEIVLTLIADGMDPRTALQVGRAL